MGSIPLTPTGIVWSGVITPQLDPVVESMLPEKYHLTWDIAKFSTMVGGDYLFADLMAKLIFHEQYALTFSQEVRMRMWARTWIRTYAAATSSIAAAGAIGLAAGILAAEAGGFDLMVGVTPSGDPSIMQGVFNRWTRRM